MTDPAFLIKVAAGVVALLATYGAKGDGFRALLSKLLPKKTQEKQAAANQDAAWRQLVDDSRERGCLESVDLLNQWMQLRTEHGLQRNESAE